MKVGRCDLGVRKIDDAIPDEIKPGARAGNPVIDGPIYPIRKVMEDEGYNIDRENHVIEIEGTPDCIREWITTFFNSAYMGGHLDQLQESLDGLESVVGTLDFTFSKNFRIYYNSHSLVFTPNISGKVAKDFWFSVLESLFMKAVEKTD
jgi:hypothetical protein